MACVFIGPEHPVWMMVVLILGIMGRSTIAPTFWPLPTAMLSGVAAAGGIALINAVGNLGGFLGPYMFGLIKDATGGSDLNCTDGDRRCTGDFRYRPGLPGPRQ